MITHPDSFNYRLLCQIKFAILKTANNNSKYGISLSTAGINVYIIFSEIYVTLLLNMGCF